jgi:hypothetical protein
VHPPGLSAAPVYEHTWAEPAHVASETAFDGRAAQVPPVAGGALARVNDPCDPSVFVGTGVHPPSGAGVTESVPPTQFV